MRVEAFPWDLIGESSERRAITDYSFEALEKLFVGWGFKAAAAAVVFKGIHRLGFRSWDDFEGQGLPKRLLTRLRADDTPPLSPFTEIETFPSGDGSVKYLYTLRNGAKIESVFMPFDSRITLCVSSQYGCALGCTFCATGAMGFKAHLTPGEIVAQVIHMRRMHPSPEKQRGRTRVVFMGMGEPLHNFNNVMAAFEMFIHPRGMVLSPREVSISTSGLVPKIELLAKREPRPNLMVSIAATTDEARSAIMPVNRAYNLETLLSALERYPLRRAERIMLSYVLIAGVNDAEGDADRLAAFSARFPSLINLIPYNEHESAQSMKEPAEASLQRFYQNLLDRGAFVTVRRSRGRDVGGACGQLTTQREAANRAGSA